MKKEDLIKKIKNVNLPEIETPSHKKKLKEALIQWNYFRKDPFWFLKRLAVPIGTVLFIILAILNFAFPQYTLADVEKITKQDPEIKEFIEKENAEIKDIEVIRDKGYALIIPKEERASKQSIGLLAEVSLKEKRVSMVEQIEAKGFELSEEEKEETKEIIEKEEKTKENLEFYKMESVPFPLNKLELKRKDSTVEVAPEEKEDKKVKVFYKKEGEERESEVNLNKEKVERVETKEKREEVEFKEKEIK